ncbi:MAG TPA: ABC transporter permease [Candidatus Paceibacterota bacterium]|nr:ABC transporter permease [Candidatus Paceibacterota bacterium]
METTEKNITRPIPNAKEALRALLRADWSIQWRNRRAMLMSIFVPVIFIISWKSLVPVVGGAAVLSICIAIGLPAIGLMGYSGSVARDRERGVFQRLRAAPIPTWSIMTSRILVQIGVMAFMTLCTILVGYFNDGIHINLPEGLLIVIFSAIAGLSFLGLGQLVVGLIRSSEAVNAAARLVYFPVAVVGAIAEIGVFGDILKMIVDWSPLGTTKTLIAAAATLSFDSSVWLALFLTLAYGVVFAAIGIKKFDWSVN